MAQILYQQVVVIKSKVINTVILFKAPPPITKARNEVICCGSWCYNQGEVEKATHALGWIPEDYKDARGVICLLCPDDYWMSKNKPGYLDNIALKCLENIKLHKKK